MRNKPREECGIFGVSIENDDAAGITYNALLAMQHRGQEGSGIAVTRDDAILYHKDVGLVSKVFDDKALKRLSNSKTAIGHNRYSTTGSNHVKNVQPFLTEFLTGRIATVHNGNVTNATQIKEKLKSLGLCFKATSDSEVISSLIAYSIVNSEDLLKGVVQAVLELDGAFNLIVLCGDGRMVAVRDTCGYRPLCIGTNEYGVAIASESCALASCGFSLERDVKPGEAALIEGGRITHSEVLPLKREEDGLCIFEYVYFARPDSTIDGLSVYEARYNMGKALARENPIQADAVCGVPDSGLEAAAGYSAESGIPMVSGFVKNRYIGRSFIYPTQTQRESAVCLKLNPLKINVEGKRIILVDDSIVRGTTSEKIVRTLKNAGAKEVHMRISSPPFRHTCQYGTDIDKEENLIANQMGTHGIAKAIGADSLGYIDMDDLKSACKKCNLSFCTKCFE